MIWMNAFYFKCFSYFFIYFFSRDEREVQFHCSRLALLSVLRSWPGLLHFCHPANNSGLRSLVNVLYLKQLEVRVSSEREMYFSGLKFLYHNSRLKCACVSYLALAGLKVLYMTHREVSAASKVRLFVSGIRDQDSYE